MQRPAAIMQPEEDFLRCYLCGNAALWVIQLAGEDEPVTEEAACAEHARGHRRRALLTPPEAPRRERPPTDEVAR